ncbi:Zn(II)2Cys6 transcription factor [Curvularia clavata]|uniref:Aspartate aminotransferase n=1 Tax=Curvularia clavata TaxID=95742 RepID=A0A9Q8Z6E8_CURCL|nr:Zn(II)2Cys6 transcription factor [Curvularia clavata]
MFRSVPPSPADPVYLLSQQVREDTAPEKVDLGVGVYRNERGLYHELRALGAAKRILAQQDANHDYEVTTGSAAFLTNAAKVLFGWEADILSSGRVTSVQAISGTGAIHLGALFLARTPSFQGKKVYIGTPAWGNYVPLFNLVGFEVVTYRHYDVSTGTVDFDSVLTATRSADAGSIFVLQGCCHNPSGADFSLAQWDRLADEMQAKKLFPLFDMAYQGLGASLDEDAYGLRLFAGRNLELLACQSFSKNFGLYGERVGVLHAVSQDADVAARVYERLRCLIRWEFSSSPAYGARLVNIILSDNELRQDWQTELAQIQKRLADNRKALHAELVEKRSAPGNWSSILSSNGLFCFLPLSPQQCERLAAEFHIHMLRNGRINVAGLNRSNMDHVASALVKVMSSPFSRFYLSDLQQKVARLERSLSHIETNPALARESREHGEDQVQAGSFHREQSLQPPRCGDREPGETSRSSPTETRDNSPKTDQGNGESHELTNPLLESPSKFMAASSGRSFYLGTSSNWSFHGQVLNVVHQHIRRTPLPGTDFLFDGSAYDLPWDGTRSVLETNAPVIPSIDYAIFLVNAVKFHCGQLVHLFDEEEFNAKMYAFYGNAEPNKPQEGLWYVQFLLIIAFGRTLVQRKHRASKPPGADFFVHALQLLPDTSRLCREPLLASEILCGIALYLQALDSRNAAHVTIGQAMRIALAEGMHTDMPVSELGEAFVQRCRKIWWSIYILDRQMSSQMGVPQSIRDDEITCQLTHFPGSVQRTAALKMQIRLARIYADIARSVYGPKGRLRKKFVISIKALLDDMAAIAEELRNSFPLHSDERLGGISRMPAHLHLMYYQKVFESPKEVGPLVSSRKIRPLLSMSLDASQKILNILESLQEQDLLETFLPWDLDSLFVSTMVLVLIRFVDDTLSENSSAWISKAFAFLDTMISNGNKIAESRAAELRKLEELLSEYSVNRTRQQYTTPLLPQQQQPVGQYQPPPDRNLMRSDMQSPQIMMNSEAMGMYTAFSDESSGFGDDLTAEQILAVAESMDLGTTDWLNTLATMDTYQMVDPQEHHI